MVKPKQQFLYALMYFLITAVLGFLLRLEGTNFSFDLIKDYRYVVHAHSHIALLGWVYLGLTSFIVHFYIPQQPIQNHYLKIFWATQVCLLGMLIFFPIQGYALFSIIFSTLFLVVSYVFFGFVLKHVDAELKTQKSFILIKHALFYMVLSSIGPWALGGIMTTLGNGSVWYKLAIYFYLHFQYNAWFVLAMIGVLCFVLEKSNFSIKDSEFSKFLYFFHAGVILTFFLSCLWASSHWSLYVLSNLGSLLLGLSFLVLWKSIQQPLKEFYQNLSPSLRYVFGFIAFAFLAKYLLQTLSGIPYFAEMASTNLDVVIGYLHWFFLGVVSLYLLFLASYLGWLKLSKLSLALYFIAFVSTEVLIFYRAGMVAFRWAFLPDLNLYLATGSMFFGLAVVVILVETFLGKKMS